MVSRVLTKHQQGRGLLLLYGRSPEWSQHPRRHLDLVTLHLDLGKRPRFTSGAGLLAVSPGERTPGQAWSVSLRL